MRSAIVTIGQEILIGQIVDTNSAWIAAQLNSIGVDVQLMTSIPDVSNEIISTINQLVENYELVLVTGGLGPTTDDVTKPALCELFGCNLIVHEPTLLHVQNLFSSRGLPTTELNAKQAEVPSSCEVLPNPLGTAPGMWFKHKNSILVSMPGVPFEMKSIMENHVLPRLSEMAGNDVIVHKTIHTFGLPESFLAEKLMRFEAELPKSISLAYLPSPVSIRLRLSSSGNEKVTVEKSIQRQVEKLQEIIPEQIFGFDDDTMSSVVGRILRTRKATLSVAESCTGGSISQMITSLSGSSEFYLGGVVAYSNDVKENILKIDKQLITTYGAVSQQVVEAMAKGVRSLFNSNYAIATSGIAGPTGGTLEKPVGTVWIAISSAKGVQSKMFKFSNDRERNILRSSVTALNMLRLALIKENETD